jgi:hypothetical protein
VARERPTSQGSLMMGSQDDPTHACVIEAGVLYGSEDVERDPRQIDRTFGSDRVHNIMFSVCHFARSQCQAVLAIGNLAQMSCLIP